MTASIRPASDDDAYGLSQLAEATFRETFERENTPEDMARYVGRHLASRGEVESDVLHIASIEDLRAWQTLLTLALRSHRIGGLRRDDPLNRLMRGFRVELLDPGDAHDNGWLRAPRFVVRGSATASRSTA
jgi:hypothetical protein